MNVKVKTIPNIVSPQGREEKTVKNVETVREALKKSGFNYIDQRVIVTGRRVTDFEERLRRGDEIIITPVIEDPGSIIAAITNFVVAAFTEYLAVTVAVIGGAFSIFSALNRPKLPTFGSVGGGVDEGSPTYSFDGITTTQEVGVPVPIIYGEHPTGGNIINQFVSYDGNKNYLNVLLGICEGEIESLSDLRINENPAANFAGITQYTRLGTKDQTVIPNFNDLHNVIPVGANLVQSSTYTYTTIDSDVEGFEIRIDFPSGLFQVSTKGNVQAWFATINVKYKLTTDVSYNDMGNFKFSAKSRTSISRFIKKEGLTAGKYDIQITRVSGDSTLDPIKTGDTQLFSVDEIKTDDIRYPFLALVGVKALATDQLSGSTPNFRITAKGKKVSVPYVTYGGSPVDWDDYYWNEANSEFRLISDDSSCLWDGSTYHDAYSANPIWCFRDLLVNDRYGVGDYVESTFINQEVLVEMAKYCEELIADGSGGLEKRFRIDMVIDSKNKALDLLYQVAATFRGIVFFSSGGVIIRIDKPGTVAQIFGMGNIIKGSFNQHAESKRDFYNQILVQFMDQDLDYKFETIPFEDEAALSSEPRNQKTVRLFTTKKSYARREARYALKVSRNIWRTVNFRAGPDAIAVQPGDLFALSHDVPQIGFSGRVVDGSTSTTVVLDREVTIEAAKSYQVTVQHADDTIETFDVLTSPSTTDTLTIDGTWTSTPAAYDKVIFGEVDILYKTYRTISVRRENKHESEIVGIEYNEDVYDDTAVIVPTTNYSALSAELQNVSNLSLSELVIKDEDGTIYNKIDVYFDPPSRAEYYLNTYKKAKVYLSDDAGESFVEVGQTDGGHLEIKENIETGITYTIAVVSVNESGEETPISTSPQDTITILGKQAPPSNVTGFDVSQVGDKLVFSWNAIPDGDRSGYIIKKGSEWATGELVGELIDVTQYEEFVGTIGEETYMIKAKDSSGNESTSATVDTITVTPPPEQNFVQNVDPWAQNREYLLTNVGKVPRNDYNPDYARDVFVLQTTNQWDDTQNIDAGLNIDDQALETSGSIEQIIPVDLETIFEFKVVTDLSFFNVSGGSITVQISTSEDGVTYTAFANVDSAVNYRAKYVKFKYLLAGDGTNQIYFYEGTIFLNAAIVKVDFGRDVAIDAGGTAIVFRDDFTAIPRISSLAIKNGIVGVIEIVSGSLTASGMTVKVRNLSGTAIGTAEIDWEVKGS